MVKRSKIITSEEVYYLKQLYTNSPKQFHTQDVNLFNVYKSYIRVARSDMWDNIQAKLINLHGRRCPLTNYFLEYQDKAYARNHRDNPDTVEGTAITLIDKTDDLVGGDIIINRGNKQKVLPQDVGHTIYYTTAVDHGVTEVTSGKRLVLITWFRKDTWQN